MKTIYERIIPLAEAEKDRVSKHTAEKRNNMKWKLKNCITFWFVMKRF